ncbi:MAG: 16S rRNA (cytidine(1402)-2'-O)-methyltransferase [Clostridia bacterium]
MSAGTLFVVATPIGNLADASPRSLEVLRGADLIACEDTRVTGAFLARAGIERPLVALHAHNERRAAVRLLAELAAGRTVALVSDAGTPAVSDPGAHLVSEAHRAGIRVSPVPGPSAAAAAYSASGFGEAGFLFAGFLPASGAERRRAVDALEQPWPVVLYEAPHRIGRTLSDLLERFGPAREIFIGRELTKKFEETARLPLGAAKDWLAASPHREQGEFALVLAAGAAAKSAPAVDPDAALALLVEVLSPSEAARIAAKLTGAPKNALYRKAIAKDK